MIEQYKDLEKKLYHNNPEVAKIIDDITSKIKISLLSKNLIDKPNAIKYFAIAVDLPIEQRIVTLPSFPLPYFEDGIYSLIEGAGYKMTGFTNKGEYLFVEVKKSEDIYRIIFKLTDLVLSYDTICILTKSYSLVGGDIRVLEDLRNTIYNKDAVNMINDEEYIKRVKDPKLGYSVLEVVVPNDKVDIIKTQIIGVMLNQNSPDEEDAEEVYGDFPERKNQNKLPIQKNLLNMYM